MSYQNPSFDERNPGFGDDPYAPSDAQVTPYSPPPVPAASPYGAAPSGTAPIAANPYAAPPAATSTSGLAIAAMVVSIIGFGLIGAILGHVAIGDCRQRGDNGGKVMSLIAIWYGWAQVAIVLILLVVAFLIPLIFLGTTLSWR